MNHVLKRECTGKHEMLSIIPTCSCGWRGRAEYAYNDLQHKNVRDQEVEHLHSSLVRVGNGTKK